MPKDNHDREDSMLDDKELGASIAAWVSSNLQFLSAGAMATAIAFARIAYEYSSGKRKRTWAASITEGILCGLISLGLVSGLELFHIPSSAATFFGAMIGFLGVDKIREWLEAWGDKKTGTKDEQKPQ